MTLTGRRWWSSARARRGRRGRGRRRRGRGASLGASACQRRAQTVGVQGDEGVEQPEPRVAVLRMRIERLRSPPVPRVFAAMNACRPCRYAWEHNRSERGLQIETPRASRESYSNFGRWRSMQAADRFRWLSRLLSPSPRPPRPHLALVFACAPRRALHVSPVLAAKKRSAMPPKKAPAQEKKTLLGRPGNNLKIGIVGLFHLPVTGLHALTKHVHRSSERRKVVLLQHSLQDRSVSLPPGKNLHPHIRPPDLGKAANFPYATINPEVCRPMRRVPASAGAATTRLGKFLHASVRLTRPPGSTYSCPRCTLRLALRNLQASDAHTSTPDLH